MKLTLSRTIQTLFLCLILLAGVGVILPQNVVAASSPPASEASTQETNVDDPYKGWDCSESFKDISTQGIGQHAGNVCSGITDSGSRATGAEACAAMKKKLDESVEL